MIVYILLFMDIFRVQARYKLMQSSLNRLYSIFCLTADILPFTTLCFFGYIENFLGGGIKNKLLKQIKSFSLSKQISPNHDFLF